MVIEIWKEIVHIGEMLSNYLENPNTCVRIDCTHSCNSNNNDSCSSDINTLQVFLDDCEGISRTKNVENDQTILVRILLVDDEFDTNFVIKIMLEKQNGFRVDSFSDPESALQNFKPGLYDLLIVDIRIPKMNGVELYNKLRMIDKNIKVCFMSANKRYYDEVKNQLTLPLDADSCFLQKPFGNQELIRHVDKIMA